MIKIGQFNRLKISRLTDFGAYLDSGVQGVEILIPAKYLGTPIYEGKELEVFVYTDSEDRLIATTENPYIHVGQFAFLEVVDVHPRVGAFLNWGLTKDLLCPFNEQRDKMVKGRTYCVYAYLDYASKRVVASSKLEKFLDNVYPDFTPGQSVDVLIIGRTEIGYRCIVNNLHSGMIYLDELVRYPEIGSRIDAFVKKVREDGKLDLTLKDSNANRAHSTADLIVDYMRQHGGECLLTDKSSPEEVAKTFACSKKDFKKAIGLLYKNRRINILPDKLVFACP